MKKIALLLFLAILLLNCHKTEAQNTKQESKDSIINGHASWYNHKKGLFAASTKYKKGTVLRVTNPANGKFVDVIVNDYGPSKKRHPKRIIDLEKAAYKKIADLKSGIIPVTIIEIES